MGSSVTGAHPWQTSPAQQDHRFRQCDLEWRTGPQHGLCFLSGDWRKQFRTSTVHGFLTPGIDAAAEQTGVSDTVLLMNGEGRR